MGADKGKKKQGLRKEAENNKEERPRELINMSQACVCHQWASNISVYNS